MLLNGENLKALLLQVGIPSFYFFLIFATGAEDLAEASTFTTAAKAATRGVDYGSKVISKGIVKGS